MLVKHCIAVLDSFEGSVFSEAHHVAEYLNANNVRRAGRHHPLSQAQVVDDEDQVFVREVFEGCVKYRKLLQVLMKGFYAREGVRCLRADLGVYTVFSYLALFRLRELGIAQYTACVVGMGEHVKMRRLLALLRSREAFTTWVAEAWSRLYDRQHVQAMFVEPYLRSIDELQGRPVHAITQPDGRSRD